MKFFLLSKEVLAVKNSLITVFYVKKLLKVHHHIESANGVFEKTFGLN